MSPMVAQGSISLCNRLWTLCYGGISRIFGQRNGGSAGRGRPRLVDVGSGSTVGGTVDVREGSVVWIATDAVQRSMMGML